MKVALVQETIDARRGGAETSTLEMAKHLARLGLDVTILCRAAAAETDAHSNNQTATAGDAPVRIVRIPAGGVFRTLRTLLYLRGVHRFCLREHFDIVHAVTPCLAANVYQPRGGTYAETVERGLAMIESPKWHWIKYTARQFNLRQRFLFHLEDTLLTKRHHRVFVAAVSEYVRRQVVTGYGFPEERTRVVFNGVDIAPLPEKERGGARVALRTMHRIEPDTPLVLFAAHNFKLKGLAELIRACAYAANGGASGGEAAKWHLVVAGRDDPCHYRRLARHFGVAERVHCVGPDTPIRDWYAAADLLAHPTWYDPCSRVVLEALSIGLPVVTTRYNGAAEVMERGRHGEVVDEPRDIAGLAAAIARTLRPEVRTACEADVARLREQLSMERHARELKALYQTVIGAEQARRRGA